MNISLDKRKLNVGEILDMQDQLNSKADPNNPNWRTVRKKEDFLLAGILELAELIESTPWKWWKKKQINDLWNIKIEAIDILHFILSIELLNPQKDKRKFILGTKSIPYKLLTNSSQTINRTYAFQLIKEMTLDKDPIELINKIVLSIGLTSEEMSAIYTAKYSLNEIRWSTGYADGSYQKIRQGMEDNVFLQNIVENFVSTPTKTLADIRKEVFKMFNC